jgi:5-methylcytosine-specific restriction enzyme A
MVDREDEEEASRIFRRLFPEHAMMRAAATTMAEGVVSAHAAGAESWSVTLLPRMVRLNVGQVEVCTLVPGLIKLVTGIPEPTPPINGLTFEHTDEPAYPAVPIASGHVYLREWTQSIPREYVDAHRAYMREAAARKQRTTHRRAFSVGVLLFLENELKLRLPRPSYFNEVDAAYSLLTADEIVDVNDIYEGARETTVVNAYERNPRARRLCIEHYGKRCSACSMSFEERYGSAMRDFIHVHHLRPLADIGAEYEVDPVADLRPLCPNCHAVVHSRRPPLTIAEVQALLDR